MTKLLLRNIRSGKRAANITNTNSIVRKELELAMDIVRKELEGLLNKVVENWKSDVKFKSRKQITSKHIAIDVYATGKDKNIWQIVDKGAKPHKIVAKNVPLLKFKTGYQSKTLAKPARTYGGGGQATGDWVAKKVVNHPGVEARNFEKEIANDYKPTFKRVTENAMKKSANQINSF